MFVSDFRKEFYEVVQNQVTPFLGPRVLVAGKGWRAAVGGREGPGFEALLSALPLSRTEGPSLGGFGCGRSVRLQDPTGEH